LGNFETVSGVTPSIVAAAEDAQKSVYSNAFKLVYCVTVAFGGENGFRSCKKKI
jgi:hypothetical protein